MTITYININVLCCYFSVSECVKKNPSPGPFSEIKSKFPSYLYSELRSSVLLYLPVSHCKNLESHSILKGPGGGWGRAKESRAGGSVYRKLALCSRKINPSRARRPVPSQLAKVCVTMETNQHRHSPGAVRITHLIFHSLRLISKAAGLIRRPQYWWQAARWQKLPIHCSLLLWPTDRRQMVSGAELKFQKRQTSACLFIHGYSPG